MFHGVGSGHHRHHLAAYSLTNLLNGIEVQRVAHGKVELVLDHPHGDDLILLGDVLRQHLSHLNGDIDFCQVNVFDTQLHLQRINQIILRDDAVFNQHGTQTFFAALLKLKTTLEILLRNHLRCKQQFAQSSICHTAQPLKRKSDCQQRCQNGEPEEKPPPPQTVRIFTPALYRMWKGNARVKAQNMREK